MCCGEMLNCLHKWILDLCNGSLYYFDDEDEFERKNYSEYEMKKKDLIIEKPVIIKIEENI
jgi:hypothetical protein